METLREESIEKGLEQGIEKGIEQGIEKGVARAKFETAKKMKQEKMPVDLISRLSPEAIEQI